MTKAGVYDNHPVLKAIQKIREEHIERPSFPVTLEETIEHNRRRNAADDLLTRVYTDVRAVLLENTNLHVEPE